MPQPPRAQGTPKAAAPLEPLLAALRHIGARPAAVLLGARPHTFEAFLGRKVQKHRRLGITQTPRKGALVVAVHHPRGRIQFAPEEHIELLAAAVHPSGQPPNSIEMDDGQRKPFPHRPREGRLPRAPVPENQHSLVWKFHFFLLRARAVRPAAIRAPEPFPPRARAAPLVRRGRANFQTAYLTMMSFFFARVMAVYSQRELSSKKRDSSKTMTKSYSDPCALWQVTA